MKTIHLFFLTFYFISSVLFSSLTKATLLPGSVGSQIQRKVTFCHSCKNNTGEVAIKIKCGHFHHGTCIHKAFLWTGPHTFAKCSECKAALNYNEFFSEMIIRKNMPDGISFNRNYLDVDFVSKFILLFIKHKNAAAIENLLKFKVPLNEFPIYNNTHSALFMAASFGSPEIVETLLQSGLKFSPPIVHDISYLLFLASSCGNLEIMNYLMNIRANIDYIVPDSTKTVLIGAIIANKTEAVKLLVKKGVDINLKSEKFGYPLHIAIEKGFDDILKTLLEAGVNVKVTNNLHRPPLANACCLNKVGAVKLLLAHGCKFEAFSAEGYNWFHFAIVANSFDVIEYLIGANVNIQMQNGKPSYVLHRQVRSKNVRVLKLLLNSGANPYESFDSATFDLVLKEKPDLLGFLQLSDPPIVSSIIYNDKESVAAFLDAGVSPSTRIFGSTSTLLHLAVRRGLNDICDLLITRGADIHALDASGFKPLNYATEEWARTLSLKINEGL